MKRHSQQGVALIITLILLAVVTVMAVAFLASSRRERGAVTTTTDTAGARLAADAALAQAEAQIMANVLATTNPYNFGLVVSTNYIPFTTGNALDDLTNMLISPRAPVWLSNYVTRAMENRFYLDLNHNAVDDPNGWVTNRNNFGAIIFNGDGSPSTNIQVGDPEWIGVLDHPDQPHGPNNRFIARYAFVAVPIGNALDLNAIHNQAFTKQVDTSPTDNELDGFLRNQGVGSWEINLAAFLADLNMNQWLPTIPPDATYYAYNPPPIIGGNKGVAFEDALSLLSYRYGYNYNNLLTADNIFGIANAQAVFPNDGVDAYSDGPLQTTFDTNEFSLPDDPSLRWAGSDNTNHFFDMQELFNPNESSPNFTNRLLSAGIVTPTHQSTYDRYTFYRLLSQMGVDSAPEQNKMNLNYDNIDLGLNGVLNVNGTASATNFVPWTALGFFTNAADRMLRAYSQEWIDESPANYLATYFYTNGTGMTTIPLISITNIPVYVNGVNVYSSAIQRVLQLAANMYDATTNNSAGGAHDWPDVFRPTFFRDANGNVFIDGYEQIQSVSFPADFSVPPLDPPVDVTSNALAINAGINTANGNVYGVPWIIGAKKGFPNFNEFSMESVAQFTRRLEVIRPDTNSSPTMTNQMYTLGISNLFGVECWNSYGMNYTSSVANGLQIFVRDGLAMTLTNEFSPTPIASFSPSPYFVGNTVSTTVWTNTLSPILRNQWQNGKPYTNSFIIPLNTSLILLNGLTYSYAANNFQTGTYPEKNVYPLPSLPHFGLLMTNRLQVVMLDGNHVIDYVQFAGPNSSRDLNAEIATTGTGLTGMWNTNLDADGNQIGIDYQMYVSLQTIPYNTLWPNAGSSAKEGIDGFNIFYGLTPPPYGIPINNSASTNLVMEAPYTPSRTTYEYISWQANDPLVHYLASDLNFSGTESGGQSVGSQMQTGINILPDTSTNLPANNLGVLNDRYQPWGRSLSTTNSTANYLAIKDPLIYYSDDWDFPTYKLPTVGWLGRVHRGTPWQTVYMKASLPNINTWTNWTGNSNTNTFDANNYSPIQDRLLFDLFTTAPNDNATRGQLSVNVGANDINNPEAGLAAWSALFSGVMAVSNNNAVSSSRPLSFPRPVALNNSASPINPEGAAGTNSPLGQIVSGIGGINNIRTNTALFPQQVFTHIGDIFAVTNLTEQSPFLNFSSLAQLTNGISDEMYEWLPQQTMSLLRVSGTPQSPMRYVIYCYGQTLKPAQNGIVTGGSLFGICTNYQVVAEAATRAIVQFNSTMTHIISTNGVLLSTGMPAINSTNAVIESFNVLPPD
jgi:hypothetical protein